MKDGFRFPESLREQECYLLYQFGNHILDPF
jgi:hypothetical protein